MGIDNRLGVLNFQEFIVGTRTKVLFTVIYLCMYINVTLQIDQARKKILYSARSGLLVM